jgi:hypothetical protein
MLTAGSECRAIVSNRMRYAPDGTDAGIVVVQVEFCAIILPEAQLPV